MQTQAITRHKSKQMTDMYAHFEKSDFTKAKAIQEALLRPDAAPETGTGQGISVLPFPSQKCGHELLRKQA